MTGNIVNAAPFSGISQMSVDLSGEIHVKWGVSFHLSTVRKTFEVARQRVSFLNKAILQQSINHLRSVRRKVKLSDLDAFES